jgi:hypothetical protein
MDLVQVHIFFGMQLLHYFYMQLLYVLVHFRILKLLQIDNHMD